MCGRPKALIEEAQRAGVEIGRTFCSACPLRLDCLYWAQLDTVEKFEGRRIVIAAHEAAFLPMPFSGDLVVVDEDIATKAARAVEIDPARLLDPDKWEGRRPAWADRPQGRRGAGPPGRGAGGPARGRRRGRRT